MFQMNAGYFLIQCASEPDKAKVYKEIGEVIRKDAKGVKQVRSTLLPKQEIPADGQIGCIRRIYQPSSK
jgi:hypothetical protein